MRALAALLAALSLALPVKAAGFFSVVEIGAASNATAGANLTITTSAPCPPTGGIVIFLTGVGGAGALSPTIVDSASNTYGVLSQYTGGTNSKITFGGTAGGLLPPPVRNVGLPSGGTISVTAGSSTLTLAAIAICIQTPTFNIAFNDVNGAGNAGTSTAVTYTPTIGTAVNDLQIICSVEVGGASDPWTESAGYTSLPPVLNINATRCADQIAPTLTPGAYSATNSVSRAWASRGRSFIPCVSSLATTGAGQC